MLVRLFSRQVLRAFSKTSVWRNLDKSPKPAESSNSVDLSMTYVPTETDKKILLMTGKYKSRDEIPPRIRSSTIDNARSKLRIRIANILMIITVCACGVAVYLGKVRQKAGDSLLKKIIEHDRTIKEEFKK